MHLVGLSLDWIRSGNQRGEEEISSGGSIVTEVSQNSEVVDKISSLHIEHHSLPTSL